MAKQALEQMDVVYGLHPVIELLKAKRRKIATLYTTKPEPKGFLQLKKFLHPNTKIQHVDRATLARIAGSSDHQGVVALTTPFVFFTKAFDPTVHKLVLVLDGIQDTRNLGAILRSAYCTGVNAIVLPKKNTAAITGSTMKSSAGLAEYLAISQPASTKAALQELKQHGYAIYLTTLEKGVNALEVDYKAPLALVIGSEGAGISADIASLGTRITLPQQSPEISYNASVAAGIFLFLISTKTGTI